MANYSIFPSITPDNEPFVDDSYSKAELERMEYSELQSIAANHPTDNVHGRMSQEKLIDGLTGEKRI